MNFFFRGVKRPTEQVETMIGPSTNLRGTLRCDGGVRIDGHFEGIVETAGNLIVGETGRVAANITARSVTVGGIVKGNIDANGCLEILSTGVVYGDVIVDTVMIDEGGQLHGASRMRVLAHPALAAPVDDVLVVPAPTDNVIDVDLDLEPLEGKARSADDTVVITPPPPYSSAPAPEEVQSSAAPDRPPATAPTPKSAPVEEAAAAATAAAKPAQAKSNPGANSGNGHGVAVDDDFDLEGIEMDIEPVIPDLGPQEEAPQGGSSTRRRRRRTN